MNACQRDMKLSRLNETTGPSSSTSSTVTVSGHAGHSQREQCFPTPLTRNAVDKTESILQSKQVFYY